MTELPRKLTKDAIVEALWEVRFESDELPELVVGTLATNSTWRSYTKNRLPLSDVPALIKSKDPNLRNQATLELVSSDRSRLIKIGSNVFSYHVLSPYCGGDQFKTELGLAIDFVFSSLNNFRATRFGLRYVNALNENHFINNITDLVFSISVAGEHVKPPLNLNYRRAPSASHLITVRIASPEFVNIPPHISLKAMIDIDVFTPEGVENIAATEAKEWIENAHNFEKQEFFRLIPEQILKDLTAGLETCSSK